MSKHPLARRLSAAAGALVFALGGAFLIAQPFGQQAGVVLGSTLVLNVWERYHPADRPCARKVRHKCRIGIECLMALVRTLRVRDAEPRWWACCYGCASIPQTVAARELARRP